jgi:hypothetical protein
MYLFTTYAIHAILNTCSKEKTTKSVETQCFHTHPSTHPLTPPPPPNTHTQACPWATEWVNFVFCFSQLLFRFPVNRLFCHTIYDTAASSRTLFL